jgi:hypothetical protein
MKGRIKGVATPAEYIAALEEPRRSDVAALDRLVRKAAPRLKPVIQGGMLGYGPFHYKYPSGREGDATRISIASNASYISLYAMAADSRGYVVERYRERFPAAKLGKCCVTFKRFEDLDAGALSDLVAEAARTTYGGAEQKAAKPTKARPPRKPRS